MEKIEKQFFIGDNLFRHQKCARAGGNPCGGESRADDEELEIAHNGVRGDDVVGVRAVSFVSH